MTQHSQQLISKKIKLFLKSINNAREGVEKKELSYTTDGNVDWYGHYGKQYGSSLKN